MRKQLLLAVVVASFSFVPLAHSAGYGAAGCGLGGMLIKENKAIHQIGAWILNNIIVWNQAFGITSGTSGCDAAGSLQLAQEKQSEFVQNNFASLSKEMASGKGENLNALAGLMGCPVIQQARFSEVTQKNYEVIFASDSTTPGEALVAVKAVVSRDEPLAGACIQ